MPDNDSLLCDVQYAIRQVQKARACGTRRSNDDCCRRALDALDRVLDRLSPAPEPDGFEEPGPDTTVAETDAF